MVESIGKGADPPGEPNRFQRAPHGGFVQLALTGGEVGRDAIGKDQPVLAEISDAGAPAPRPSGTSAATPARANAVATAVTPPGARPRSKTGVADCTMP